MGISSPRITEYGIVMWTKKGWNVFNVAWFEIPIPYKEDIAKPFATQLVMASGTFTSNVCNPDVSLGKK